MKLRLVAEGILEGYGDTETQIAGGLTLPGDAPGTPQYKRLESDMLGYDRTVGETASDAWVGVKQGLTGLAKTVGVVGLVAQQRAGLVAERREGAVAELWRAMCTDVAPTAAVGF